MKKRKLKGFVLPTIYVMVIGILFVSISYLGSALQNKIEYGNLSVSAIKDTNVTSVIKTQDNVTSTIVKPYTSESVSISKSYYDMSDEETKQQNSLVYYEKTYLQNSGVLYTSKEEFDVLSVYDGTVTNVAKDEILGNYIEITHNTNLKTIYYSLGEITVKQDDDVTAGTIIAKSGDNMLEEEQENCLLLEVYYNGKTIDPEDFYNMKIEDLD